MLHMVLKICTVKESIVCLCFSIYIYIYIYKVYVMLHMVLKICTVKESIKGLMAGFMVQTESN